MQTDDAGGSYQELTELQDVKISEEMPDVWGSPLQPKASEDYSYCLPGSMSEAMGSLQQQSDSQNNPASSPTTSDDSKPKKMVFFNDSGQPIGEGSAPFVTYLGSLARIHCPIIYEKWRDVPNDIKEMIWKLVTGEYNVCISYKDKILRKLNIYWRGFKCELRAKHYDMYDTDEERKSHCPRGVIQEDWDTFVDNQSTPTAQARRGRGKSARKAMKNPHTSGRLGAARTAEKLKKGDPIATITRTELFLATHCRKDGSCLNPEISEQVEQVKAIVAKDPSSIHLDLDHDPVAQVFGREKKGCVRGLGEGVSKSGYLYSFPARDQLLQERRMQLYIQEQIASQAQLIDDLRQQIAAQAQMTAELREMITAQAFYNQSQAPVDPSPPVERLCQLVERPCELLYFGGAIVATGKLLCGGSHDDMGNHPNADVYEVTVDVIHDAKASLFSPDGDVSVLGNVQAGETISWPRIFTRFVL
ncbi:hypothetical protein GIB67_039047 [Kingdonia uniflora]|uniref:Transposase n=1 Tax=Kingdonia uniflora TaxID=39325 RepID=A0A7J7LL63_9MAGN|nr:hypothetical protein GIB67_039047 [Kingdonia uniflora]